MLSAKLSANEGSEVATCVATLLPLFCYRCFVATVLLPLCDDASNNNLTNKNIFSNDFLSITLLMMTLLINVLTKCVRA